MSEDDALSAYTAFCHFNTSKSAAFLIFYNKQSQLYHIFLQNAIGAQKVYNFISFQSIQNPCFFQEEVKFPQLLVFFDSS